LIDENNELWLQLCEQAAAVERDPRKLDALVTEINRLLEEKEARLNNKDTNIQLPDSATKAR
jgi:hypothetical protein